MTLTMRERTYHHINLTVFSYSDARVFLSATATGLYVIAQTDAP